MRRRAGEEMPERLTVFAVEDWPGDDAHAAFERWKAARRQWADARDRVLDGIAEATQTPDEQWTPEGVSR